MGFAFKCDRCGAMLPGLTQAKIEIEIAGDHPIKKMDLCPRCKSDLDYWVRTVVRSADE